MARLGLGVGLTRRGGGAAAPTISSLFAGGQQGAWYDPSTLGTLFQDTAAATAITSAGQSVARVNDRSGRGNNATQATASKRPTYQTGPARLALDKVDDEMSITVPGGWVGTMVLGTNVGTASYEVTISAGAYVIGGHSNGDFFPGNALVGQVIRNGSLTTVEKAAVEAEMVENGAEASYGAVTNMNAFWRGWSEITVFPSIDTSSVTTMSSSWEACSRMVVMPWVDMSSNTVLGGAWFGCSALTTLPASPSLDTSSVTDMGFAFTNCNSLVTMTWLDTSSVNDIQACFSGCTSLRHFPENFFDDVKTGDFQNTFQNTNLSTQSIDRILVSIVAANFNSGNRRFNQSGGDAPSVGVGQPAIDTLTGRGYAITVTGGYVTP